MKFHCSKNGDRDRGDSLFFTGIYTTECKEVEISELSGIIKGKKSGNSFESFISLFGVISPALN